MPSDILQRPSLSDFTPHSMSLVVTYSECGYIKHCMEVVYENSEDNVQKAIVRFHALRSMLDRDMSFDPEGTSSLPAELLQFAELRSEERCMLPDGYLVAKLIF